MPTYLCQGCGRELQAWSGTCPHCGHELPLQLASQEDPFAGKIVAGRYKVIKRLGQGGMGVVYLAEQQGIGQRVALKFLASHLSQDPQVARRFLNEAKSYARVTHPNAVTLHEFGQDAIEGALFIAMEYVEGTDLKSLLNQRKHLPLNEAVDICLQLSDVLAYAHEHGVIHRDLKPENIMLRRSMRGVHVKVLDFGIARLIEEGAVRLTGQNGLVGTPLYMAPEQAMGKEPDARADVYALGINLFEMLSGEPPFNGTNFNEILQHQLNTPFPKLPAVQGDDLSAVDAILQKACAKDPAHRYANMTEFAGALGTLSPVTQRSFSIPDSNTGVPEPGAGTMVLEKKPSTPLPDRMVKTAQPDRPKPPPERRGWLWGVGVVALALVAGLGYRAMQSDPRPTPKDPPAHDGSELPRARTDTASDADRRRLLAEEIWLKAHAEFLGGNLESALTILTTVPDEPHTGPKVEELKAQITDARGKLERARQLSAQGNCGSAIQLYDGILKAYPALREARRERDRCAAMLPPSLTE